jgi:two-component system nitrogen regulation response regulator GlnG
VFGALENYRWPGNVRELENVIQRATVVAKGDVILLNDLPPEVVGGLNGPVISPATAAPVASGATPAVTPPDSLDSVARLLFQWARKDPKLKILPTVERELIVHALAETSGNQVQAAKLLGITRATLRKRVEKFGIKRELSVH